MKLQIDLKKRVVRYDGHKDLAFAISKEILPLDYLNMAYYEGVNYDFWEAPHFVKIINGKSNFYHSMNSAVHLNDGTASARTYYRHKFYNIQIVKHEI